MIRRSGRGAIVNKEAKPSRKSPYNIKERPAKEAKTTRGRGRAKTQGMSVKTVKEAKLKGELPYLICERSAKVNKSGFEGFKGTDDENDDAEYLDAQITFSVNQPISLLGIKFASEMYQNPNSFKDECDTRHPKDSNKYEEEAFIYLMEGTTKLADSHIDDEIQYNSMINAMFITPCKCEKDKIYKIKLLCNVDGAYPVAKCADEVVHDNITFKFNVGKPADTIRDGIIRALLYKKL